MSDFESAKDRLLELQSGLKDPDGWLQIVSSCESVEALKKALESSHYQFLQLVFASLVQNPELSASVDIAQIIAQSELSQYPGQVIFFLSRMGHQPYASLGMLAGFVRSGDDLSDDKGLLAQWENTKELGELLPESSELVYDEGLSIMLLALRKYLGFTDN